MSTAILYKEYLKILLSKQKNQNKNLMETRQNAQFSALLWTLASVLTFLIFFSRSNYISKKNKCQ